MLQDYRYISCESLSQFDSLPITCHKEREDAAVGSGVGAATALPPPLPLLLGGAERTGGALHALLARAAADPECFDAQVSLFYFIYRYILSDSC